MGESIPNRAQVFKTGQRCKRATPRWKDVWSSTGSLRSISRKAMKEIKGKNVLEGRVPSKETKDEATGKDKKN